MNLKPSPTLAIAQAVEKRRALGKKAWSLSTPSFPEPDMLPDISSKWLKLSEPAGIPELRRKAQNIFFGAWNAPNHECIITSGAKAAIFSIFKALIEPGDTIIIPQPAWPSYNELVIAAGAVPITMESSSSDFSLNLSELKILAKSRNAKAIILANPCNPTGRIMPSDEIAAINKICNLFDMQLILDQSFSRIIFDHEAWKNSIIKDVDNLFLVDSFSKNYLMQGARVASALVPGVIADKIINIHQTLVSSAPSPAQQLALWAIEVDNSMPDLSHQRTLAKEFIELMNWSSYPQQGTFYFFPKLTNIKKFQNRAESFGIYLLRGNAFGNGYRDYFRLCFAKPITELETIFSQLSENS